MKREGERLGFLGFRRRGKTARGVVGWRLCGGDGDGVRFSSERGFEDYWVRRFWWRLGWPFPVRVRRAGRRGLGVFRLERDRRGGERGVAPVGFRWRKWGYSVVGVWFTGDKREREIGTVGVLGCYRR